MNFHIIWISKHGCYCKIKGSWCVPIWNQFWATTRLNRRWFGNFLFGPITGYFNLSFDIYLRLISDDWCWIYLCSNLSVNLWYLRLCPFVKTYFKLQNDFFYLAQTMAQFIPYFPNLNQINRLQQSFLSRAKWLLIICLMLKVWQGISNDMVADWKESADFP